MSNSKNGVAANTPKSATAETNNVLKVAEKVTETRQVKTLQDVFENLEQGNRKRQFYQDFSRKLDDVKNFRSGMDGSALLLIISNEKGEQIRFNSLAMITDFIDESVKKAEQIRSGIEADLLKMSF